MHAPPQRARLPDRGCCPDRSQDHPFASDPVRPASFSSPPGPPPSYESVVDRATGAPASSSAPTTSSAAGGEFDIVVADPVKQGEGVSAYVSYKVGRRAVPQVLRRA